MELEHVFALQLAMLFVSRSMASDSVCDHQCHCQNETMTCKKNIPSVLPGNSSTVIIKDLDFSKYVDINPFGHESWKQVLNLTISDSDVNEEELSRRNDYTIRKGLFNNTFNLQYLAINSVKFVHSTPGGFTGIHNLEVLDLSGCHRKTFSSLTSGLTGVQMSKLGVLKLKGFSNLTAAENSVIMDSSFFDELKNKPITELDLGYTNLFSVDIDALSVAFPNLRKVNLERGRHLLYFFILALVNAPDSTTFSNIEYINCNYAEFPPAVMSIFNDIRTGNARAKSPFLGAIRDVRMRGVIPKGVLVDILLEQINNITCPVVSIHRPAGKMNIKWVLPVCKRGRNYENVTIKYFDIGENGIVKIDPEFVLLGIDIKGIDLSKNKLGDNVNLLTKHSFPVTKLILSHNGIRELKRAFFEGMPLLTFLDLSHNLLKYFVFPLSDFGKLEHLDISFNSISYIDPYILVSLGTGPSTLVVIANQNPFQCKCENKHFIRELLLSDVFVEKESLTCLLSDTTIPISINTLSKIEDLCRWPSIRATIITCGVLLFIVFLFTIIVICRFYRARREKRRFQNLLDRYRTDPNRPEYPVFLSFSSRDQDLAHRFILPRINRGLQKILEVNDNCVATGDLNFLPGFTVAGEIIRCIEASRVVIFCISEAFCESSYCKDEVVVADYTRTPVILLFLEELETTKLPKLLQKYFYTSTRCKIIKHDGRHVFVPHWNVLCRSIVQLFEGKEF